MQNCVMSTDLSTLRLSSELTSQQNCQKDSGRASQLEARWILWRMWSAKVSLIR